NPVAPEITAVYVSGSAWQQSVLDYLAANSLGDATLGYRLPGGPSQLNTLPWTNLTTIAVVFSRDVNITNSGIQLRGSSSIAPPPRLSTAAFAYNNSTFTATWTFANSLPLNKYQLSIPATAVTSRASNQQLDGDFTNGSSLLPSGDGTTGGNFNF